LLNRILDGSSEKSIFEKGKRMVDHAVAANNVLIKIIKKSDDLQELRNIEKLADKEVFELSNAVTSGAVAPNLIDDMIRFVNMEDDIVDTMFNLGRAIIRYRGRNKKVDKYIENKMLKLTALMNSALLLLYEMHNIQKLSDASRFRFKIEAVEQEGDVIKDSMLDYAYSTDLDFKAFYHIQNVAYLADDILDNCEDAADMITSIMRSVLT
jgi:uncharacterized protein Yka (UPF0111/DUF47 family)